MVWSVSLYHSNAHSREGNVSARGSKIVLHQEFEKTYVWDLFFTGGDVQLLPSHIACVSDASDYTRCSDVSDVSDVSD